MKATKEEIERATKKWMETGTCTVRVELTIEEIKERFGNVLTDKEIEHLKTLVKVKEEEE